MSDLASVTALLRTERDAVERATAELIEQLDRRSVHVPYATAFVAVVHAIAKFQVSETTRCVTAERFVHGPRDVRASLAPTITSA